MDTRVKKRTMRTLAERVAREVIKKGVRVGISLLDGNDIYEYKGILAVDGDPGPYVYNKAHIYSDDFRISDFFNDNSSN